MALSTPKLKLQQALDATDPFVLTNWMVHDLCFTVANDLWHPLVAAKIEAIAPITDAASTAAAHKALAKLEKEVSKLELDTTGKAAAYLEQFSLEMVVPLLDLELVHENHWATLQPAVNSVILLSTLMAMRLPKNASERVIR